MFGLCIAERYYREGFFRIEYFPSIPLLNMVRATLDSSVTSWVYGEEIPKRKQVSTFY